MFKLTREEQWIVAFLLFALLLGMTVREWRARHLRVAAAAALEIKSH
jgi:hypothetical protein